MQNNASGREALRNLVEVIPRLRRAGLTIAWVKFAFTEDEAKNLPPAICHAFSPFEPGLDLGTRDGQKLGRAMILGDWNTEIHDDLKRVQCSEDFVLVKSRSITRFNACD